MHRSMGVRGSRFPEGPKRWAITLYSEISILVRGNLDSPLVARGKSEMLPDVQATEDDSSVITTRIAGTLLVFSCGSPQQFQQKQHTRCHNEGMYRQ